MDESPTAPGGAPFARLMEALCLAPLLRTFRKVMNRFERFPEPLGEAELRYLDGEFRILRPGSFVRCAVTGQSILLDDLRYWSVDLQEAYASPEAVLSRMQERGRPAP